MVRIPAFLLLAGFLAATPVLAQTSAKDQTQLPQSEEQIDQPKATEQQPPPAAGEQPPAQPPPATGEDLTQPPPPDTETDTEETSPDDLSFGEIPDVTVIELTQDIARRSVDAFVVVRDKYKDANIEDYEKLQDFVDQTDVGKNFEADIKASGFTTVEEWNVAIASVGFAYSAIIDNNADELEAQIADIEKNASIAQDLKDRWIKGLRAMIPSENNRKVVQALIDDPAYTEKLKLLAEEE
jgi:hypothetical protein